MGVPALFRWLSKKYPKIVNRVAEETPTKVRTSDGEITEVPVRYEGKNPNGFEIDNLYLDMNGIVHPCTHPEGKPAPETEEDMMVEIFSYTERVVNMARPRKVLMMAIDGVAPRAKMNQQRSRRFRAAQDAADKEEEKRESIKLFEAMGHPVSEETRNQKTWDSNAITPGTPFMSLLSQSLKYWVSYKLTNDPGWKDLKIIISDSSVPGEGEHKIVDWIRRQRSHTDWDPNTSHVIYGLDADLIMLSLATHEPHFKVLREDVFFQGSKEPQTCRNCGQPGHLSANCKGQKKIAGLEVVEKAKPVDPKPFIFLDVACLREYLAIELNVPHVPFPFDLELAIDDWIFMIFFVGNDFLPHLPSLEIREGAIDALLKIWRAELPRMGGYLTNHGKVALDRAQIILEGLAKSEDEIFQKRKDDEDRQDSSQKRRRIEEHTRQDDAAARGNGSTPSASEGTMQLNGTDYVAVTPSTTARGGQLHPSLPTRPTFDIVPKDEVAPNGKPAKKMTSSQRETEALKGGPEAIAGMQGTNADSVKNRRAIRMANLSAAQKLKAELAGGGQGEGEGDGDEPVTIERADEEEKEQMAPEDARAVLEEQGEDEGLDEDVVAPAIRTDEEKGEASVPLNGEETMEADDGENDAMDGIDGTNGRGGTDEIDAAPPAKKRGKRGRKRHAEHDEDQTLDGSDVEAPPNPEADQPVPKKKLKLNADGTVEGYVDDVRLWEPGYRERYYQQKFGVDVSDRDFISQLTRSYMEGLCWVLEYYYQGVPAWDWYYPYHYAPFAQDFQDVGKLQIEFDPALPFKPFAQLLGVFPAASRIHLPKPLQSLMTDDDSPIIDFYPSDFDIDMNGKKMAWQGVALLPFIDQHRLIAALDSKEDQLNEEEKRRNKWGDNVMFISEGSQLYDPFCSLYTLQAGAKPVPIDIRSSQGTTGAVLADPGCVPNSSFDSPLPSLPECPDLTPNNSLSVRYYFPRQSHSHRSIILHGYRPGPPVLSESDKDWTRRGGPGGGRGGRGGGGPRYSGGPGKSNGSGHGRDHPREYAGLPRSGSYPSARELAGYGVHSAPPQTVYGYQPPPVPAGGYGGYGYGGGDPYAASPYGGGGGGGRGGYGGPAPSYGGYPPPPPSRNPYAPPPNPYAGAPPPPRDQAGYGGYGGGGGRGGAYNPYGAPPPAPSRRY